MPRLAALMLLMSLLVACELQPAPKQSAAPPAPVAPRTPAPPPAPDAGVGSAAPAVQITEQCRDVGLHIANVMINSTTDPGQRSIFEQDRTRIVRATAEACTNQGWNDAAAKCYLASQTQQALKACETKFTPPPTQPVRPRVPDDASPRGTGSAGSAAPARAGGAGSAAPARAGGAGSAAPARAGGAGSAAPRPRPGAGAGSGAPAGAGSGARPATGTAR